MLVIGLTGGIGSGKSAAAEAFARRGVPVIDTDQLARELVQPGQPALEAIVERFGSGCLDGDGRLDRARMRRRVFADPTERRALEAILHPRIRAAVRERLARLDAPYCLVVVPLLVESGMTDMVDRVLVVDVSESVQLRRVMARDEVPADQARAALQAQTDRNARLARADDVLDNGGALGDLEAAVAALHRRYLDLAQRRCRNDGPGRQ